MDNGDCHLQPADAFSSVTQALLDNTRVRDVPAYHQNVARRITGLETEIRALKTSHNAVTPICRLPAELLSKVFLELVVLEATPGPDDDESLYVRPNASWLPYTHVCRLWREVALNCGRLWAKLVLTRPDLTTAMITHSKGVPLDVELVGDFEFSAASLEAALAPTERLRSVHIVRGKFGPKLGNVFARWNQQTLPLLQNLVIRNPIHYTPERNALPQGFLCTGAPSLRVLELQNCGVPWHNIPIGSNLLRLRLCQDPNITSNRPSWIEFMHSFAEMQRLEALDLTGFLPHGQPPKPPPTTLLHNIRSLSLKDTANLAMVFLNSVRVTTAAKLEIKFASDLGPALADFDFSLGDSTWRVLERLQIVEKEDRYTFHFWFWDVHRNYPPTSANRIIGLWDRWDRDHTDHDLHALLTTVLKRYDLSTVTSLEINGGVYMYPGTWKSLFSTLPKLHIIRLHKGWIEFLLDAMEEMEEDGLDADVIQRDSHPPFPSLTSIQLSRVDMGDEEENKDDEWEDPVDRLIEVLSKREPTHQIRELQFERCRWFGQKEKDRVEEMLGGTVTVDWDGHEEYGMDWVWFSDDDSEAPDYSDKE